MTVVDTADIANSTLDTQHPATRGRIAEFVNALSHNRTNEWAEQNYRPTILALVKELGARRVLEIGGGRWPLLSKDEILSANIDYIVNDISENELALAPDHVKKTCFNVAQPSLQGLEHLFGTVDLIFSYNVFEHVADVHQAYRNIRLLLAPGGVCLNYHPVLFSPPFVVNWLLPETLSSKLLRLFFPHRNADEVPKHPALYDHCIVSERERAALQSVGFSGAWQIPFWYHDYFKRIPGIYQLDRALTTLADRNNWTQLASYSYTIVEK